jgi:arylamine N-acetyltransferase
MDRRLAAYCTRLGLAAPPAPDAAGLAALQAAHRQAIAFENLDLHLGRGIAIGSDSVFAKLVTGRRGGYCFEHNRLLADMLALLGLPSRMLLARSRVGLPPDIHPPRTHVLLLLELGGQPWIADAGFGGSFVPPLPLYDGAGALTDDGARHRLRRAGEPGSLQGEWLLERAGPSGTTDGRAAAGDGGTNGAGGEWQAQYCFDLAQVAPDDLEQANHWTANHPRSRFLQAQIVSIVLPGGFASMVDRRLSEYRAGQMKRRIIAGPAAYRAVLASRFGLDLSAGEAAVLAPPA